MTGENDIDPEQALVAAMADAILSWNSWCHRRKDSYIPIDEDRGRVHHSMDCTPVLDTRFAADPGLRGSEYIEQEDQALLPVAIVQKSSLQEFDARSASATALTILTHRQSTELSAGILAYCLLSVENLVLDARGMMAAITEIVGSSDDAGLIAGQLIEQGTYDGVRVLDPELLIMQGQLPELIRNLSTGFLLCVLIPFRDLGRRIIIKVSYLWEFRIVGNRFGSFIKGRRSLRLPMTAASDTQSYHIELRLPSNVRCLGMSIPGSIGLRIDEQGRQAFAIAPDHEVATPTDTTLHLNGSYLLPPYRPDAWVELEGARNDAFWASMVGGLLVSLLCVAILSSAVRGNIVLGADSGAITLLLSIPAVVLGYVSTKADHSLGQPMTLVHRIALLAYAVALLGMAAAPILVDDNLVVRDVWIAGTVLVVLVWVIMLLRLYAGLWHRLGYKLFFGNNPPAASFERDWRLSQ